MLCPISRRQARTLDTTTAVPPSSHTTLRLLGWSFAKSTVVDPVSQGELLLEWKHSLDMLEYCHVNTAAINRACWVLLSTTRMV